MIVEDEPMLAFQLEDEVREAGHDVVGCAVTSTEALEMAAATNPDLVFLDLQLADGATGIRAAQDLVAGHAAVVFVTASARDLPSDLAGAIGVIDKPYSNAGIRSALRFLAKGLCGGVLPPPPLSLRLAPQWTPGKSGLFSFA
jgi:CheY-like chemotaxis protein